MGGVGGVNYREGIINGGSGELYRVIEVVHYSWRGVDGGCGDRWK